MSNHKLRKAGPAYSGMPFSSSEPIPDFGSVHERKAEQSNTHRNGKRCILHAAEPKNKEDSAHNTQEHRGEVGVFPLRRYRTPVAINKVVEIAYSFHTCFSASNPVASVSSAFMANRLIAMLANADRRIRRMIETVHVSGFDPNKLNGKSMLTRL